MCWISLSHDSWLSWLAVRLLRLTTPEHVMFFASSSHSSRFWHGFAGERDCKSSSLGIWKCGGIAGSRGPSWHHSLSFTKSEVVMDSLHSKVSYCWNLSAKGLNSQQLAGQQEARDAAKAISASFETVPRRNCTDTRSNSRTFKIRRLVELVLRSMPPGSSE